MDDQSLQDQLNFVVQSKKRNPKTRMDPTIWNICHDLAVANYLPALNFFVEGLGDSDWSWRQRCMQLIGFHYPIPSESAITEKVRKLLTLDRSAEVRMTAADVLGRISRLPDQALVKALSTDGDWFVRRSAYLAMVQLMRVSYEVYVRENDRFDFETETPEPSIQELKRLSAEEGIEVPANTFDFTDPEE